MVEHIRFRDGTLELLDQRVLPHDVRWIHCSTVAQTADAIRDMVVRGAPAIGITAAYGMALAAARQEDLADAARTLVEARPTAVNLAWAVEKLRGLPREAILDAACALHAEDEAINRALGEVGAALLPRRARVYTHCNAGTLATGAWGTALGVVRSAWASGRLEMVWAGETRPYLQGARLTAWELAEDGIPVTLVADVAAASLMAAGRVDAVIVGADRVAANGDVANKIGTLGLAVLAQRFDIPFYVAVPTSTLDPNCPHGSAIPIEERDASEVRGHRDTVWAADVPVYNPAFDVTPAAFVSAWITERGLWRPESRDATPDLSG